MVRPASLVLFCGAFLVAQSNAQEVFIGREVKPKYPKAEAVVAAPPKADLHIEKAIALHAPAPSITIRPGAAPSPKPEPVVKPQKDSRGDQVTIARSTSTPAAIKSDPASIKPAAVQPPVAAKKTESAVAVATKKATPGTAVPIAKTTTEVTTARPAADAIKSEATPVKTASIQPPVSPKKTEPTATVAAKKETPSTPSAATSTSVAKTTTGASKVTQNSDSATPQPVSFRGDTAFIKLADGFDFPIGKPDAQGYYKARGFRSRGHLGEDWDGVRGGDSDLGDAIYSIGDGVVVFARDVHMGWGNVVIVRHTYREGGVVKNVDALYGHLNSMLVHKGQAIARGQKIATMGNAHGLYDAHLHLEIRKNIEIGMSRAAFARDYSNYYDPTQFINSHRHLQTNGGTYRVALNTFTRDAKINFDKARNYSHARTGGGSSESAAALKRAVAAKR
jgi:murein DD-endopeptidase MepM/ murein hydrolase activator NlpD